MSCGLGCIPSIVQHIQQPLAEVPAQWQPLVRRLWQCWVASAAGLLWNWLCVLALWASLLARGKDLLFAGGLLLLGPLRHCEQPRGARAREREHACNKRTTEELSDLTVRVRCSLCPKRGWV